MAAPPYKITYRFPGTPRSVPRARTALREVLGGWGSPKEQLETAVLLLSELMGNAVLASEEREHPVGVRLGLRGGVLRIDVSDAGAGVPLPRTPGSDEEHGRGLFLVQYLADRWGFEPADGGCGKTVWCELGDSAEPGRADGAAP